MRQLALLILGAGLVLSSAMAGAGEVVDAATRAEKLAGEGKHAEALDAMSQGLDRLWAETPLTVRKALFVSAPPTRFGVYQGRDGSVFKPGEKLFVYAEPVGYGFKQEGDIHEIALVADVILRNPRGKLGDQKGFATFGVKSLSKNREFFVPISYDFGGLDPGEYKVITRLTDTVTGKSAEFELPFTIQ